MCALSHFSRVRIFATLCTNRVFASLPGSSVHGVLPARILECVTMPSSRDLPDPGIEPAFLTSPALAGEFFTSSATWEAQGFAYTVSFNCRNS